MIFMIKYGPLCIDVLYYRDIKNSELPEVSDGICW